MLHLKANFMAYAPLGFKHVRSPKPSFSHVLNPVHIFFLSSFSLRQFLRTLASKQDKPSGFVKINQYQIHPKKEL